MLSEFLAADALFGEAEDAADDVEDHVEDGFDGAACTVAMVGLTGNVELFNLAADAAESIVFLFYPIVACAD